MHGEPLQSPQCCSLNLCSAANLANHVATLANHAAVFFYHCSGQMWRKSGKPCEGDVEEGHDAALHSLQKLRSRQKLLLLLWLLRVGAL